MDNVNKIAEIFEQYGWPGILAIGLILVIWFILQKLLKKSSEDNMKALTDGLNRISTNINNQNEYLVQTITEQSIKQQERMFELLSQSLINHDKEKAEKHAESMTRRMDISDELMTKLYEILHYHNAHRVVILEFHNAKENLNGLSFLWYDVQYEARQRKILPISSHCRDMQLSRLYKIIDDIYKSDSYVRYDKESFEQQGIYNLLYNDHEKDVVGLIYQGLHGNNNDLIGLICLEYLKGEMPKDEDIDGDELNTQVAAIATLLKFNHYDLMTE